jgi:hypothetical protein
VVFIGYYPEKFREVEGAKQLPIPHYIKFNVGYLQTFVIKLFSFWRFIKLTYTGKFQKHGYKLSDADNFIGTSMYAWGDR